ncbi:MAG: GNAT family N-acetyltransferase [Anaerolineae bacterium]|nr:GNAT family N-acetyltransferase [Anaerolineae bacterium]
MSTSLTIRGQQGDDWDQLFALLNTSGVFPRSLHIPYMNESTLRDRYSTPSANTHTLIAETGVPSGRKRIVGVAWLSIMRTRRRHTARLDLVVHPDYAANGTMPNLLQAALDLADNWLGLRRMDVVVHASDGAAIALYEQYGFESEAALRRYAFGMGAYQDGVLLARLRGVDQDAGYADSGTGTVKRREKCPSVQVRGVESDDWEDLAAVFACPSVFANTLQLPYLSRDFVRERLENPPSHFHGLAAVVDEQVVGYLGLHTGEGRQSHSAYLGMMVHEDYQSCGVGSALMDAAINLAENWLNICRIELQVFPDNAAGIALYRKFGFEIEGTLRAYAYRDGRFVDSYTMARIRDEGQPV